MKDSILILVRDIVSSEIPDELPLYTMFESSLYDVVKNEKEHVLGEQSHFGGEENIVSYYVLAIVAWTSTMLAEEGVKIAKVALYQWIKENKSKILHKFNSDKYVYALKVIEKYLENEVGK